MDINKNIIYKSFLENNNRINELLQQAQQLTLLNISYFMGCGESEENDNKNALVSINKGDEMKFQGKTIFENKKCNTWYTRYRENGKQYYISGKTQKEVLGILKNKLNYIKKEKKKTITLYDWYNQWLKLFKLGKVKESTLDVYKSLIKHISNNILDKNIKDIESIEIQKILTSIKMDRTRQKIYELLNDLFTRAEKHNICKNIMNIIDKPKHTKTNGIALTQEDKTKFIKYCLKNQKYIFLITLYQGLRKGEALAITGKDIDLKNKTIVINKSLNIKNRIDSTKNISSNRTMPIFEPTLTILQQLNVNTEHRLFNISNATMQREFTKIINVLNLNKKYTIHSLRHTFITNCQDSNIPEHIIQSWVGHTIGSNVTKQVYTHIQKDSNDINIITLNHSKFYSNSTHF